MAYDNADQSIDKFTLFDFGGSVGSSTVYRIFGPAGKVGKLRDIGVATSEICAWTGTDGLIQVGTTADPDAYGQLNIATGTATNTVFNSLDDTDAIIDADIPANSIVVITLTEGTGGTETGQGIPIVVIDWF